VQGDYGVDVLAGATVVEVMTRDVETLTEHSTMDEARARLERGPHGSYPIVDDTGRCVGIVAREDLLTRDHGPTTTLADVTSTDVVTVSPDDTLLDALTLILDEEVGHLPVVDDGRLVGLVTRTDILHARTRQLQLERRQPGVRFASFAPRRRRAATPRPKAS
jgi:CBS domain-containing protein